jgi:pyruvate dehydrogenase E2 component (dihydrolipoamide acetyltransferase)
VHLLHLPQLGYTMESGIVTTWLVAEGDSFETGQLLYEVETSKNTVEIEAKLPGTLARVVAPGNDELPVGALLAVVADPGEQLSAEEIDRAVTADTAHDHGAQPTVAQAPPPGGGPDVDPEVVGMASLGRTRAVPKARALAAANDLPLGEVTGSGPNGTVTVADVEAGLAARSAGSAPALAGPAIRERRPLRGVARAMAENVARSWREVPQFVQQYRVDATRLVRLSTPTGDEPVASVTELLISAVARAATEVPEVNATFAGDEVLIYDEVNVAVAVATERGLVVPVVHGAERLTSTEAGERLREVVGRARASGPRPEDTAGGTITLSNLGQFGVETGVPLVNAPQVAIVFTGAAVQTPVVVDGGVEVRPVMGVAVAFDHRVVDGVTAAKFGAALRREIEEGERA